MIYQLTVFVLIIIIAGILNYPLRILVLEAINMAKETLPTQTESTAFKFLEAISYWQLLLLVLLPAALWFYVQMQRPRET